MSWLNWDFVRSLLDPIVPYAVLLTSVAAVLTAVRALISVGIQRKMVEATMLSDFNRRYKSPEMGRSINTLVAWFYRHPTDFVQLWLEGVKRKEPDAIALDESRRMASMYFVDVARLYGDGFISKKFARIISGHAGLNVYYEVIAPMNLAHRPGTTVKTMKLLKRLWKNFEGGLYDPAATKLSA